MEQDELIVQKTGGVCTLTINRVKKRNSLSSDVYSKMKETFGSLSLDGNVRAVIITGAGDESFCAGYDIGAIPKNVPPEEALQLMSCHEDCLDSISSYKYPVIAMINGYTFGGGLELTTVCDIRIASNRAIFGMPAAKLGMVYSSKGIRNFISVLGFSNTKEIFFTGRSFDAQRAKEIGLLQHVVAHEDLRKVTLDMAREISENAPLTLTAAKFCIDKYMGVARLSKKYEEEIVSLRLKGLASGDLKEGQRAFKEKRKPRFAGK